MKTDLSFAPLAQIETELLAVLAVDTQTAKGPDAKPQPVLLTSDEAVKAAAAAVLASGEFKAGANETLLLHAPAGLKAKRLLHRGPGQTGQGHGARRPQRRRNRRPLRQAARNPGACFRAAAIDPKACSPQGAGGCRGRLRRRLRPRHLSQRPQGPERAVVHRRRAGRRADEAAIRAAFAEGVIIGESQNFTRSLVNEPGNELTPTVFGQRAAAMAKEVGLVAKCTPPKSCTS